MNKHLDSVFGWFLVLTFVVIIGASLWFGGKESGRAEMCNDLGGNMVSINSGEATCELKD